ncbi:TraB/GumN family protein [Desulfohalobium retbaense]|uniref:TraB family protein n=1 Tax=Desulfohalobium retbaense (strain ATCC 49708 / DSM 5692 / JCM 16813 / HR100) TaxID=485915 RepID=C8X3N8_DESRD|nr:TraB/GumN family protein [Desulfohalobium retbaense]ACV69035.1 TraB family protein [Desulfohalobium retbaense DSM 5692]
MSDTPSSLPENIQHVQLADKEVYLLGTAHVSPSSVQDVQDSVAALSPDTICIELCPSRYQAMRNQDAWKKMDILRVLKERKAVLLLAQLLMTAFYRKLGEQLGVQPGAEMLEGARQADATGAHLVLADRDVQITLRRVWGYLSWWQKIKMAFQIMVSLLAADGVDAEQVESLKEQDQLEAVMESFGKSLPEVKKRLIDERDIYLAEKIRRAPGQKILAVVGAGHVAGIREAVHEENDLAPLETTPPKSVWPTVLKWAIPALIIGLLVYGFFQGGAAHSIESISIWILVNGVLSSLGAALALAHPLTILITFVAAPLTSLNPMFAAGWAAGIVQAWVRRPTVTDLEDLPLALTSIKAFWFNPVCRILLVVVLANLGSSLGSFVAGSWIAVRSF